MWLLHIYVFTLMNTTESSTPSLKDLFEVSLLTGKNRSRAGFTIKRSKHYRE